MSDHAESDHSNGGGSHGHADSHASDHGHADAHGHSGGKDDGHSHGHGHAEHWGDYNNVPLEPNKLAISPVWLGICGLATAGLLSAIVWYSLALGHARKPLLEGDSAHASSPHGESEKGHGNESPEKPEKNEHAAHE